MSDWLQQLQPVLPNPLSFLSVHSMFSTSLKCFIIKSCAILSPIFILKSSSWWLNMMTWTLPVRWRKFSEYFILYSLTNKVRTTDAFSDELSAYLSLFSLLNGILSYSWCYFVQIWSISQKFNSCAINWWTNQHIAPEYIKKNKAQYKATFITGGWAKGAV